MKTQRNHSVSRTSRWLVSVMLVVGLLMPGAAASARIQALEPIRSAASVPASELVQPDGTLDLTKGVNAAIDLRGWNVSLDPAHGPVFAPNATGWNSVGNGLDDSVLALAVNGSDVFVGGNFLTAVNADTSIVEVNHIAKWDGSTWSALGNGLNGAVSDIAVNGSDVYVGGGFLWAANADSSSVMVNYVAKWNGSTWSALGKGVNGQLGGYVYALAVSGGNVYAGGNFTMATNPDDSTVAVKHVAKWNGLTWSALGDGVDGPVYAFATTGSDLYVGGYFSTATNFDNSTVTMNSIAKWNGSTWSPLGSGVHWGITPGEVYAVLLSGSDVFVGGIFPTATNPDDSTVTVNHVARWNGSTWSALGKGLDNGAKALAIYGNDLYIGGDFTMATNFDDSTVTANYVAKWNGSTWGTLGKGVMGRGDEPAFVLALAMSGSDVYVGGQFWTAANADDSTVTMSHIAKYITGPIMSKVFLPLIRR